MLNQDGDWATALDIVNGAAPAANDGAYCYRGYGTICESGPFSDYALPSPMKGRHLKFSVTASTDGREARGIVMLSEVRFFGLPAPPSAPPVSPPPPLVPPSSPLPCPPPPVQPPPARPPLCDGCPSWPPTPSPTAPPALPPVPPTLPLGSTCRFVFGFGDCREYNFCSGRGLCVDGRCECPPQYLDANCSVKLSCNYWDEEAGAWSTEGISTSVTTSHGVSSHGVGASCATTHLTTFGGVITIPTSAEELLAELKAAFTFQVFSMEEAFSLLSSFSLSNNVTIITALGALLSIHLFCLLCLGFFRGHRATLNRLRSGTMTEDEKYAHDLRMMLKRQRAIANLREGGSLGEGGSLPSSSPDRMNSAGVDPVGIGLQAVHQRVGCFKPGDGVTSSSKCNASRRASVHWTSNRSASEFPAASKAHLPPRSPLPSSVEPHNDSRQAEAAELEGVVTEEHEGGMQSIILADTIPTSSRPTTAQLAWSEAQTQSEAQMVPWPPPPTAASNGWSPPRVAPPRSTRPLQSMFFGSPLISPPPSPPPTIDAPSTRMARHQRAMARQKSLEEIRQSRRDLRAKAAARSAAPSSDETPHRSRAIVRGFISTLYQNWRNEHGLTSFVAPCEPAVT